MEFYFICSSLLLFFIFLFAYTAIHDIKEHTSPWSVFLFCAILTFVFKSDFGIHFWGLEYEDAYSFSFCARQFPYGIYPSSFLIDAISIGSLENPLSTSTYGGHFITYPIFISLFTNIFGWSPDLISIINTFTAFCILLVLAIFRKDNKYWFIAPILFCCAPIINVFTTCFLSETFSSLVCITFIYTFFQKKNYPGKVLCITSFGIALLCKRENLALGLIPILEYVYVVYKTKDLQPTDYIIKQIVPFAIIIVIYFWGFQNVFDIERIESNDIGQQTFSIQNFINQFPVFVKSLLSINIFTITFYLYIGYTIYNLLNNESISKETLLTTSLFIFYLILYSSHYRGYFYTRGEEFSPFETYRYINNIYYLIPLSFCRINSQIKRKSIIIITLITLCCFSFISTIKLRNYFYQIEYQIRFKDTEIVSDYIKSHSNKIPVLVSENILLYQNICDNNFNVCDIRLFEQLRLNASKFDYYYLLSDKAYLKERYSIEIDMQKLIPLLQLSNNAILYKYTP